MLKTYLVEIEYLNTTGKYFVKAFDEKGVREYLTAIGAERVVSIEEYKVET